MVLCWFVIVLFRAGFEFGCWVLIMVALLGWLVSRGVGLCREVGVPVLFVDGWC